MDLFLQQENVNDFFNKKVCVQRPGRGVKAIKFEFSTLTMSINDLVKILCQIKYSEICIDKKKTKYLMYSIMAQTAKSRHQPIEYLTWKDGHNRRPITIFRKLRC